MGVTIHTKEIRRSVEEFSDQMDQVGQTTNYLTKVLTQHGALCLDSEGFTLWSPEEDCQQLATFEWSDVFGPLIEDGGGLDIEQLKSLRQDLLALVEVVDKWIVEES